MWKKSVAVIFLPFHTRHGERFQNTISMSQLVIIHSPHSMENIYSKAKKLIKNFMFRLCFLAELWSRDSDTEREETVTLEFNHLNDF